MIDIAKYYTTETPVEDIPVQQPFNAEGSEDYKKFQESCKLSWHRQLLRFSMVGGLNTVVDLCVLNSLLWLFPTTSTATLLMYNALAFSFGAANSFLLNKYWTFRHRGKTTPQELTRFMLTTLCGMVWSTLVLWLASTVLHPAGLNTTVWANASKGIAVASSALLSYIAMRLWVFVSTPYKSKTATYALERANTQTRSEQLAVSNEDFFSLSTEDTPLRMHSLSVVLPIYNEEVVITATLTDLLDTLKADGADFEIIAVNDGSSDSTGAILAALAATTPQLRVVTHEGNQGYGAALVDGFAAASKDLTLFMDSDGQFDIADLPHLLAFIDSYDAVIGYRQQRQDTEMRKLNAWGWKMLVGFMLGVHVRDIDCAFKLLRTDFLHEHVLQTRGAMINAELLYTLKGAGCTYREVAVQHLPRQGGRATGARPSVIVRAFRELFAFAWKQRRHSIQFRATATQISQ